MGRGNVHQELAVALTQIKAAEQTLNDGDGLDHLCRVQKKEASERSIGAFFAICILICVFGIFAGYAGYASGMMGFLVFAYVAVRFWRYRTKQNKRAEDMRRLAEQKTDSETVGNNA